LLAKWLNLFCHHLEYKLSEDKCYALLTAAVQTIWAHRGIMYSGTVGPVLRASESWG
jgi:hypothetical protein